MADFQRLAPEARKHLRQGPGVWVRLKLDPWLLILLLAIMSFGLIVLYSGSGASEAAVQKQLVRYGVALLGMVIITQINLRLVQRWMPLLYVGGLLLLLAVLLFGVGAKGAQRWLSIPGLPRFQPSEIMKLVVPLTVAWYLASRPRPPHLTHVVVTMLLVALPVLLIAKQPDLGTSLLIGSSGIFVIFFAGLLWRYVVAAMVLGAAALPLLWMGMRPYQQQRVITFLDPESDPLGAGWNIIQSKIAIGSGGVDGKGWLQGTQSHLDFLPETHTDFIIAVLAEEFGLVGVCALLSLYFLVLIRGLIIAGHAAHPFDRMLAASLTLTFFVYVVVNIGMVSGVLPVVGVPLPLVSYGGTSAVTLMASLGLLMSIHARRPQRT
ncbi:MAG: rod shape-determining protein RodA [Oceanospirillaceae bacterium]|jgi:rod shape determining protein RodA|nr:rod shape-determining protein RodA [Oceanospirillaceae bacterium]MBT4442660.1 rod shape-determining protein RodA [Oceanospirillaceae bacterium]MBT6077401.1 rod shape-determining protein RodA [Oceanospirillaceae bacterium]MBT7331572.1 rod shape-determining protein RodA [Oceanospirillaceae bacterium]